MQSHWISERICPRLGRKQRLGMQRRRHVNAARIIVNSLERDVLGTKIGADAFEEDAQRRTAPATDIAPALDADLLDDYRRLRERQQ